MYDTELYENFSKKYSIVDITKTLVISGVLLANSSTFHKPRHRVNLTANKDRSDDYITSSLYLSENVPTWSGVEITHTLAQQNTGKDTAFLQFLLDSPEMDDSEYQAIQEKRQHLNQWL